MISLGNVGPDHILITAPPSDGGSSMDWTGEKLPFPPIERGERTSIKKRYDPSMEATRPQFAPSKAAGSETHRKTVRSGMWPLQHCMLGENSRLPFP